MGASAELFPDANFINGSSTVNVAVFTVVVSPLTVKSPVTVKFATCELPVEVIAPQPTVPRVAIFLLPSRTTALLAAAVPAVTVS